MGIKISKSNLTLELEKCIFSCTKKIGVFSCYEVTMGWNGKERVDYMTYDTKGIVRCYEIKVSKSDFYSKCKKTFVGHYNYYVMTKELYELVKNDIPKHIGVYCHSSLIKKAKKVELGLDIDTIKDSMIRSLCRENDKIIKSNDKTYVDKLNRIISRLEQEKRNEIYCKNKYRDLLIKVCKDNNLDYRKIINEFL